MPIFGVIPFIKLHNDSQVKQQLNGELNDEMWDGELSHLRNLLNQKQQMA